MREMLQPATSLLAETAAYNHGVKTDTNKITSDRAYDNYKICNTSVVGLEKKRFMNCPRPLPFIDNG